MAYLQAWFLAFVFTQMVEVPIYAVGLRVGIPAAFGASAITHPIVWFVIFPFLPLPYVWVTIAAEAFAIAAEAAYFTLLLHRRRAWLWSIVANGASFGTGILSRWLFGMP